MRELLNDEIGVVSGGQPNNEEVVVTRIRRICNPSSTNQTDGNGLRGTLAPESCYASVETDSKQITSEGLAQAIMSGGFTGAIVGAGTGAWIGSGIGATAGAVISVPSALTTAPVTIPTGGVVGAVLGGIVLGVEGAMIGGLTGAVTYLGERAFN
ncbi:MAG: hypothetical protein ACOYKM_14785 [Caulobacterales bacterium]|jgi:hypothetical protein